MDYSTFLNNNFGKIIFSLVILLGTLILKLGVRKVMKATYSKIKRRLNSDRLARTNTIRLLAVNIINSVLIFIAVLTILSTWDINVTPVLTGIGIFGIALSFGSQSLVKDFISGIFIILEDQYNVGDTIKVGSYEGVVKKITIRLTIIKDKDGNRVYIPNSKIDIVTRNINHTKSKK